VYLLTNKYFFLEDMHSYPSKQINYNFTYKSIYVMVLVLFNANRLPLSITVSI